MHLCKRLALGHRRRYDWFASSEILIELQRRSSERDVVNHKRNHRNIERLQISRKLLVGARAYPAHVRMCQQCLASLTQAVVICRSYQEKVPVRTQSRNCIQHFVVKPFGQRSIVSRQWTCFCPRRVKVGIIDVENIVIAEVLELNSIRKV